MPKWDAWKRIYAREESKSRVVFTKDLRVLRSIYGTVIEILRTVPHSQNTLPQGNPSRGNAALAPPWPPTVSSLLFYDELSAATRGTRFFFYFFFARSNLLRFFKEKYSWISIVFNDTSYPAVFIDFVEQSIAVFIRDICFRSIPALKI